LKKRDAKLKLKEEPSTNTVEVEVPLRVNFGKFLADERKQAVIEMSKKKLRHSTDDSIIKVFEAMTELD